ncbi:hypothetical protein [Pseudomonas sp. NPDC089547]|uniref:hypothetical protein n=1 Tax=Pseudomonas sp. NPDC089547 TaxID=3390652 RepID=UPI003D058B0E
MSSLVLRFKEYFSNWRGFHTAVSEVSSEEGSLAASSHAGGLGFDYLNVRVGDLVDGRAVTEILHQSNNALIFMNYEGVRYFYRGVSLRTKVLIYKLESLMHEGGIKFRGAHKFVLDDYRVSILRIILSADSSRVEVEDDLFQPLLHFIDNKPKVEYVFENNPRFVVFLSEMNEVSYQLRSSAEFSAKALSEFRRLKAMGHASLSGRQVEAFNYSIASGLISALREPDDVEGCFSMARNYLDKALSNRVGIHLAFSVFGVLVLVLVVLGGVYFSLSTSLTQNLNMLLAGVSGGMIGAAISVLQRSKDVRAVVFDSHGLLVLQAITRLGLGCCFGVIAIIASKAGFFFEMFVGDHKKMFLLAVVAGFSERIMPEFIERVIEEK